MSTLFKNLADQERKLRPERAKSVGLIPTDFIFEKKLKQFKVIIWGAFLLSIVALIGTVVLYQMLKDEKLLRSQISVTQNTLEKNTQTLEEQVSEYKVVVQRLREQLQNYSDERKTMRKELERNQVEVANLEKKFRVIEERGRMMEDQMTGFLPSSNSLPPPTVVYSDRPNVQSEAEMVIENSFAKNPNQEKISQVLSVNRKFNFIVLNLGLQDGINVGDSLNVTRESKVIGEVQVEKLYDVFCAATILNETSLIQEGDILEKK